MASLTIARDSGYADWLRSYSVILDGTQIGEIKDAETRTFFVSPGKHDLVIKLDWCGSKKLTFVASEEVTSHFRVMSNLRGAKVLFGILYLLFARNSYLRLEQMTGPSAFVVRRSTHPIDRALFIRRGIFWWGLPWAVGMILWQYFDGRLDGILDAAIILPLGLIGGAVFGACMWSRMKDRFGDEIAAKNAEYFGADRVISKD